MFRASSYSDDFTMVQIDTPELRRVRGGRAALQQVGEETNLPFGASKWAEGAPTQDLVCLGIGFDVTDPERPVVYVPDESVEEVVFLMQCLVDKPSAPVSEIDSLASKLLRQTMVVERGRLYVCGLFAATRSRVSRTLWYAVQHPAPPPWPCLQPPQAQTRRSGRRRHPHGRFRTHHPLGPAEHAVVAQVLRVRLPTHPMRRPSCYLSRRHRG